MLRLLDRLGGFLPLRASRCDESLEDAGVDVDGVTVRVGRSELFCNLDAEVIRELLGAMDVLHVRTGARIMRQGERGDSFLVLASGHAVVTHLGSGSTGVRVLANLTEPTGFGEDALLGRPTRGVTVTMASAGILLRMKRDAFAAFVARRAVDWVLPDAAVTSSNGHATRIWVGVEGRRQAVGEGVLSIPLSQLRERMAELDRSERYFCYCRDGKASAVAAFLLKQRGFEAFAVQDGRSAIARDAA